MKTNKNELTITGYSDDIISLDGSISDEFSPSSADDTAIIKLPDGTQIKVFFDSDGIWRTQPLTETTLEITIIHGDEEKDTNDVLTVHSPIEYLTWTCADGSKGVLGNIPFSDDTNKKFELICDVLDGVEFKDMKTTVKAIIQGIDF